MKIFFPGVGSPHCTDDQNRAVGDVYARNVEAGRMVFQAPEAEDNRHLRGCRRLLPPCRFLAERNKRNYINQEEH